LAAVCIELTARVHLAGGVVAVGASLLPVDATTRIKDGASVPGSMSLPCVVAPATRVYVPAESAASDSNDASVMVLGRASDALPTRDACSLLASKPSEIDWI